MSIEFWLVYVSTVLVLMITPGPSQLLMLTNSLGCGFKRSRATAAGDLTANALQMMVASAGLASILSASKYTFLIIKWMGVAYLLLMGIKLIRTKQKKHIRVRKEPTKTLASLYAQGFLTSASNPKAVIFFAALFPQFLDPNQAIISQLCILGATYLALDGIFLSVYGAFADWLARKFKDRLMTSLDKISGSFLILAATLLGLKRV